MNIKVNINRQLWINYIKNEYEILNKLSLNASVIANNNICYCKNMRHYGNKNSVNNNIIKHIHQL